MTELPAWTLDAGEDIPVYRPWRHAVGIAAGLVATASAVCGAVFLLNQPPTAIAPDITTPVLAWTPPVPDPVPVLPPVGSVAHLATDDERYINRVLSWATDATPNELPINAHAVCKELRAGKTASQVKDEVLAASPGITEDMAIRLVADAMAVYPHCAWSDSG